MKPLFNVPPQHRHRTSDVLKELSKGQNSQTVTLRDLTSRLGDRTFGVMLIILAGFNVIPLVSIFSGVLVFIIGIQLFFGSTRLYIPASVLDKKLPSDKITKALEAATRLIVKMERFVKPRWHFMEAPVIDRLNGLLITVLGFVITLPIPFTNIIPAAVIMIMALGLLERDGMIQAIALFFGASSLMLIIALM